MAKGKWRSKGKSDTGKTDTAQAGTAKSDVKTTGIGKSDANATGTAKAETAKSDAGNIDSGKSETKRADTGKNDGGKSETAKPTTGKTDIPEKPKDQTMPDESWKPSPAAPSPASAASRPAPAAAAGQQLHIDDAGIVACYANFCRVSSTPEELIMDLGLNPNPYAQGEVTVSVSQRVIMNHFTAKRLLSALSMALQRHEQAFGVLETDVRRRVRTM